MLVGDNLFSMTTVEPTLTYTATITKGGICLRECRIVAELLTRGLTASLWRTAIVEDNLLQAKSVYTATGLGQLIKARLEPLGEGLWKMIRDGDRTQATQAVMAGAVKHSRLLGDFMDLVIREQRSMFATTIPPALWTEYIAGCRGRDPEMPVWSESTLARLRSSVFSILAESGYLSDTRRCTLQRVYVDEVLATYLKDQRETYVLRCLEVMG